MKNLQELLRSNGQQHQYSVVDLEKLCVPGYSESTLKGIFTDASLLVNCAGVTNHNVLTKLNTEAITTTINLNLVAPILLSKMAVLPFIRQLKKSGVLPSILNVSSMLSISGVTVAGTSPYAALKAGLLGFTQSLAAELNGKIRVNAVLPALVPETEMGKTGSSTLPTVSLHEVVEACENIFTDDRLNGQFIVADGKGCRTLN